ncbi:MAG: flagellar hook capping FlgD N-terminal domain-containing protein [Planctomycetota bacterium]
MDVSSVLNGASTQKTATKGYGDMKTEDFVKILIAQLTNQNPLEPMENGQLLDQVSSISSLESSNKLISTLGSLGLSQSLGSASALIGKTVAGKVGSNDVTGVVDKAVVEDGEVFVMIGDIKLPIGGITEVS